MTTEKSITPSRGPKIGTNKAARAAAQTAEFALVRKKANDLLVSIEALCELANVPFGTVKGWKNKFPRTLNAQEQLASVLALPSDSSGCEAGTLLSDSAAAE